ncbi:phosphopentomutase [Aeromonas allosaccharophila]|uniref:phosphopentomutase n=1 Tax=Aeromonas allosaccharophila TaxID=656 RepID=UPI002ADFD10B|nr:phosphopentomutase [Aeromonas allosaccharophila]
MRRFIILLLDSLGVGSTLDADKFNDKGANTLGHIAEYCARGKAEKGRSGRLNIPNLNILGLGLAAEMSTGNWPEGLDKRVKSVGAYGYANELSTGKDTQSGHWEIAGVPVTTEWGYFENKTNSFPPTLLDRIVKRAGLPGYLGNCHASGTDILVQLGQAHISTGKPIFYTSADSVFQIACHEGSFGLERLFSLCDIVRDELDIGQYNIGRVIARPFIGSSANNFLRTGNRHDLAVKPPTITVMEKLIKEKSGTVIAIGKISDIYAGVGVTKALKATGLTELFDTTINEIKSAKDNSIVFTNFVDFDSSFGHRRDVAGYAAALEYFDNRLPELLKLMGNEDILLITADHGCDPTWPGTDHTREHIPVLLYGNNIKPVSLGRRESFADIGQSISEYFGLSPMDYGVSMLKD